LFTSNNDFRAPTAKSPVLAVSSLPPLMMVTPLEMVELPGASR
jgi:hypothetical protein